jgi:hypothetical protein
MLLAAASRILPRARWKAFAVSPRTFLRWHQQLVRGKWTYPHRGAGRLPVFRETVDLILRLARENPMWGYLRIGGELLKLGIRVSATTIRSVLRRNGLGPAHRQDGPSWSQFLRSQAHAILAFDFFTMENGVASHPVCPIRHRAGVPAGARPGRHREPGLDLGHPAGPEPGGRGPASGHPVRDQGPPSSRVRSTRCS